MRTLRKKSVLLVLPLLLLSAVVFGKDQTYKGEIRMETPREATPLSRAYPNPFNPVTRISFALAESAQVSLRVYNILGQEMAELQNGKLPAGNYEAVWDAGSLTSGYYFYHLRIADREEVGRLILLK